MNWKTIVALGLGLSGFAAAVAFVIRAAATKKYVLMLTVSGPGAVDLATGTHTYSKPTQVTVTASPQTGYQANWRLNGVDVEQGVDTYSVYVNSSLVTLGVYFTPVGPPHGTIAGIRSVGTIGTLQNYKFTTPQATGAIDLVECQENWNPGTTEWKLMQFKVYDQGYVGIPGVTVNVYPDINPDGTVFKGLAFLAPAGQAGPFPIYGPGTPLVLVSDSEGLVSFYIRTVYSAENPLLDGAGKVLSQYTNVFADKFCALAGSVRVNPVWKGLAAGLSCFWTGGGGGGPVQYSRNIRAEIVGSAFYTVQPYSVTFTSRWI